MASNFGSCTICAQRNPHSNSACDNCGARLPWVNAVTVPESTSIAPQGKQLQNLWVIIGSFLVPILGIVLYFVYRVSNPPKANSAIQAAAVGLAVNLLLMFIQN